jgi:4a-hydroxytetrahydrobiopterin dehydratase
MSELATKSCIPCRGGVPPLPPDAVEQLLSQVAGWTHERHRRIAKTFHFGKFTETIAFVNRIAELAEAEGHHPVMHVGFRELTIEIWTHKIEGLTESDFVLAAKIDALAGGGA